MLSPITQRQFAKLQQRYPAATIEPLPSGAALVTLPNMELPHGWSSSVATLRFIVPAGYPGPSPDCFWSDPALVLASGGAPQSSQSPHPIPETQLQGRWFSWHVVEAQKNWHPNRDDLMTYVSIILDRFRDPR